MRAEHLPRPPAQHTRALPSKGRAAPAPGSATGTSNSTDMLDGITTFLGWGPSSRASCRRHRALSCAYWQCAHAQLQERTSARAQARASLQLHRSPLAVLLIAVLAAMSRPLLLSLSLPLALACSPPLQHFTGLPPAPFANGTKNVLLIGELCMLN